MPVQGRGAIKSILDRTRSDPNKKVRLLTKNDPRCNNALFDLLRWIGSVSQPTSNTGSRRLAKGSVGDVRPVTGLYSHFASKRDLYAAVLDRALEPMAEAMRTHMRETGSAKALRKLPAVMTDLLLAHPKMSALFQQTLQGEASPGQRLMRRWLDRLLAQGVETLDRSTLARADRTDVVLQIIAMFNLTTGYFLSHRAADSPGAGKLTDPAIVAR